MNALTRRAQAVLNDRSIDPRTRAIIRYGLETNDPWLAERVKRADRGQSIIDTLGCLQATTMNQVKRSEALAEMICRAGDESAAALLVLMGTLENSAQPKALENTAKHFAFTRCGEANLDGMVDAQFATVEGEMLA